MATRFRLPALLLLVATALPAAAAENAPAGASRATLTITASVSGQARVLSSPDGVCVCVWTNTATHRVALVAAGDGDPLSHPAVPTARCPAGALGATTLPVGPGGLVLVSPD